MPDPSFRGVVPSRKWSPPTVEPPAGAAADPTQVPEESAAERTGSCTCIERGELTPKGLLFSRHPNCAVSGCVLGAACLFGRRRPRQGDLSAIAK